jgi:hypothetical protein
MASNLNGDSISPKLQCNGNRGIPFAIKAPSKRICPETVPIHQAKPRSPYFHNSVQTISLESIGIESTPKNLQLLNRILHK